MPAPLLSCFPFNLYSWTASKSWATHLLLFPLITWARLDYALLSDLLALQKLHNRFLVLVFSPLPGDSLISLSSIPSSRPPAPCPIPCPHRSSRPPLPALGDGQGFPAGGSCGESRPSWLRGRGPSCLCWARGAGAFAGEVNPASAPAGGQRCPARGNDGAQNVLLS